MTQIVATSTGENVAIDGDESCTDGWKEFHQIISKEIRSEKYVADLSLPFLRSSAIFFHFITGVQFPALDDVYDNYGEALLWLRYLGVECIEKLVQESWAKQMLHVWSGHTRGMTWPWTYPVHSSGLISLPSDYSELINAASLFTCPNSEGDEARTPAMCLVCGKMLCSQVHATLGITFAICVVLI